jgi:L-amino acid N-acyltransferase YncA
MHAEFAIVIPRALSGQGFGARLMRALIARCVELNVRRLWGDVMTEYTAMLALARKLGFAAQRHPHDTALVRVELRLDDKASVE